MRFVCVLIALMLPGVSGVSRAETPPSKLNVVVILADDLGGVDLGCYGSKFHRTPNLDRLAGRGLRFTRAYASCPVCSPTRAALMTGKVPARLGLTDWLPGRADRPDQPLARPKIPMQLALEEVTLAEALKDLGRATAHIGKWHLGGKGFEPQKQGFDLNIAGDHTGTPRSYFAPYANKTGFIPGLEKAPKGEYLTDRLTTEAEKFIEKNRDKPFFLYLAHHAVHTPMRAKAELIKKYPAKMIPGRQSNAIYAAMVESLDDSVGRVVKKLDELKLTDSTLIVFTSDNGGVATQEGPNTPATYNGPLREGKGHLYEGGVRVPMIVVWPGVVKPGTSPVPVVTHDIYPTVIEACGGKLKHKIDGLSLVLLLREGKSLDRDALYWHYPHYANQSNKPGGSILAGRYKLIEFYETGRRELFDLQTDQGENRNLAPSKPEIVKELAAKLDTWRKQVGAKMPTPNPIYRPNPQNDAGVVTMHARTAQVTGTQLRFEPLPHKNTLGFWTNPEDTAKWEFTITKPGMFVVEILQGCGTGNGGSEVEIEVASQTVKFTVEDTGGWQAFKARTIGEVKIDKPGRYTLTIRPRKKAKAAVMDCRQVVLRPKK